MVLLPAKSTVPGPPPIGKMPNVVLAQPLPHDVIFVIEGTALCGAYLHELKQTYIYPSLE